MKILAIGDKVKVTFESGNKRTGRIIRKLSNEAYIASFGRGEDQFTSGICWTTWDGKNMSWKENWRIG